MPANPVHIHAALQRIGLEIPHRLAAEQAARREAMDLLRACSEQPAAFRRAAEAASTLEPALRCALPLQEDVAAGYACGEGGFRHTVIAADGSQSAPDRHAEIMFGLINVGWVVMRVGSAEAPAIDTETSVLFGDELHLDEGPPLSEGDITLRRDAAERHALLHPSHRDSGPAIALIDGPLELWGSKDPAEAESFAAALAGYLQDLHALQGRGWLVAGYVDKPGADLVVRMLELSIAAQQDLRRLRRFHPLRRVSDRWLFGQVLSPRQRSAVFAMQSTSRAKYTGALSLHFFYLNVGGAGRPAIARIEIPSWVAEDRLKVETLHRVLLDQCAILGAGAYPYALHRAHEAASIAPAEVEQLKLRLLLELRKHGLEPEQISAKSLAKRAAAAKGAA